MPAHASCLPCLPRVRGEPMAAACGLPALLSHVVVITSESLLLPKVAASHLSPPSANVCSCSHPAPAFAYI